MSRDASSCWGGGRGVVLRAGEEQRLVAVDPASGAERERLLDVAGRVASLDRDASGRHLAYVTDDGALWLWSGGGEARRLGSGFRAVAW